MRRLHRTERELPPLLTIQQFAVLYQVNPATVMSWIREGRLPAQKIGNRIWRIRNDYETFHNIPELNENYVLSEVVAAEIIGCTPRNVRYLCADGKAEIQVVQRSAPVRRQRLARLSQ